jgi:hypothetical protein
LGLVNCGVTDTGKLVRESHPPHYLTNPPYPMLSELVSFGLWLQKQGYRNSTVHSNVKALKALAKRANLLDSECTKEYLALAQLSEGRKQILAQYPERFYIFKGIAFAKPRYRRVETLPFMPTETEIDQLISAVGKKMSVFPLLLKETGMRAGEGWNLKWTDIDSAFLHNGHDREEQQSQTTQGQRPIICRPYSPAILNFK